jgi:hypothetical protein
VRKARIVRGADGRAESVELVRDGDDEMPQNDNMGLE